MANQPPYLALLRGINVGGKNVIPMADLRHSFEVIGCSEVRTYIQSGNILFRSEETNTAKLTKKIKGGLSRRFGYEAQTVVLSKSKYLAAVRAAPVDWGKDDQYKHNAMFLLGGLKAKKVLAQLTPPKPDIETVAIGPGVIFWSASKKQLTRTTLMKLAANPVYQQMTVRNHNTIYKLLELLSQ